MGKPKDSGRIDLRQVFHRVQEQMLANMAVSAVYEHPLSCGVSSERHWINLFNRYLPQRYRATSGFIVDADGQRSRQIDLVIYDHFYSPLLFHDDSEPYIPAESVYAVFEVKRILYHKWILDAGRKAASVRRLRRTSVPLVWANGGETRRGLTPGGAIRSSVAKVRAAPCAPSAGSPYPSKPPFPILAGVLGLEGDWKGTFRERMSTILSRLPPEHHLDLGCSLRQGAFETTAQKGGFAVHFSEPEEGLIYFVLRLLHRLQRLGAAPAIDLADYARALRSCES